MTANTNTLKNRLNLHEQNTAIIIIDMQNDYCSKGFYMDKAGYDIDRLRRPITPIQQALSYARLKNIPVLFTRQYQIEVETDNTLPENDYPTTALKGEPGWEIVSELTPKDGEIVLDKTTCDAFISTDMNGILHSKGIKNLIFCGNTFDVCVHSTLRHANDLGYSCITLTDCCGTVNEELHKWSIESIKVESGVFGEVATAQDFIDANWVR